MTLPRRSPGPVLVTMDDRVFTPAQAVRLLDAWAADHGGPDAHPRTGHRGSAGRLGLETMPPGWTVPYLSLLDADPDE